uniref:Cytochrome c-type biogenesis protein CcmE/CycJ n=1 Tax=Tanacetum cinerariifolium TaxID=118510 RepID=A0A6L2JK38_TANCI|nr:cytochrome c-type biogenesis protein CcmE/CycJ [Tanacetum cinerariifolium]
MQNKRLWTYALSFSCIAGFIIIVLNQFQDQLVFYVTPTDALSKYLENPTKNKFRLGMRARCLICFGRGIPLLLRGLSSRLRTRLKGQGRGLERV